MSEIVEEEVETKEDEVKTEQVVVETKTSEETSEEKDESKDESKDAPKSKKGDWVQTRIDELTREKHEARREAAQLKAEIEELKAGKTPADGEKILSEAEIERRASAIAEQRLRETDFNKRSNEAVTAGQKKYSDFQEQLLEYKKIGGLSPDPIWTQFVEATLELDAPHEVLYALAKDLDEAQRILKLSPAKQGIALAKFAGTIGGTKSVSKAPPPVKDVVGGKSSGNKNLDDPSLTMEEWVAIREKERKAKREAGR